MEFYVIEHLAEDRGPVAPTGTFKLVRIHVIDFISQWCESTIHLPFQGSSAYGDFHQILHTRSILIGIIWSMLMI